MADTPIRRELVRQRADARDWYTVFSHPHPRGEALTEAWNERRADGRVLRRSNAYICPTLEEVVAAIAERCELRLRDGFVEVADASLTLPDEPWTRETWPAIASRRGIPETAAARGGRVVAAALYYGLVAHEPILRDLEMAEIAEPFALAAARAAGLTDRLRRVTFAGFTLDLRGVELSLPSAEAIWLSGYGRVLLDERSRVIAPNARWVRVQTGSGVLSRLSAPRVANLAVDLTADAMQDAILSSILSADTERLSLHWLQGPGSDAMEAVIHAVVDAPCALRELIVNNGLNVEQTNAICDAHRSLEVLTAPSWSAAAPSRVRQIEYRLPLEGTGGLFAPWNQWDPGVADVDPLGEP